MSEQKVIDAENISGKAILVLIYLVSGVPLAFLTSTIGEKLNIPSLSIIGLCVFVGLPMILYIIFNKRIFQYYTKKVRLIFYDDHFRMIMFNYRTGIEENTDDCYYRNIKSCTIEEFRGKKAFNRISFILSDNKTLKYNLKNTEGNEPENIPEFMYLSIRQKQPGLELNPLFFASQKGKLFILIAGLLFAGVIIFFTLYDKQDLYIPAIVFISLLVSLFIRQKNAKAIYEKLKKP